MLMSAFVISPALRQLLDKLKGPKFEMNIPYMYVDTVGDVTVGVGHDIDANNDLLKLPFIVKRFTRHKVIGGDTGISITSNQTLDRPASQAEIKNEYDFLKNIKALESICQIN